MISMNSISQEDRDYDGNKPNRFIKVPDGPGVPAGGYIVDTNIHPKVLRAQKSHARGQTRAAIKEAKKGFSQASEDELRRANDDD